MDYFAASLVLLWAILSVSLIYLGNKINARIKRNIHILSRITRK